jgi:hypothetical protein
MPTSDELAYEGEPENGLYDIRNGSFISEQEIAEALEREAERRAAEYPDPAEVEQRGIWSLTAYRR